VSTERIVNSVWEIVFKDQIVYVDYRPSLVYNG
jgi:hypothetical protein